MKIADKIIHLRKTNHLSQDELARALEVSRQSLCKWEKGNIEPRPDKVIELAKLFKISIDDLIDDDVDLIKTNNRVVDRNYKPRYFSTNGYRGEANKELTSDDAYKIGRFLGWYYSIPQLNKQKPWHKARIVIGKDTRRSSYMFEYAIAGGAASSGADVYMMHVTTTPSVGFIVRSEFFDCGVMITASHNPSYDNGIKLVDNKGEIIDDNLLYLLEAYLDNDLSALGINDSDLPFAKRSDIGIISDFEVGREKYINYLASLSKYSLNSLKIGLDTGNGASYSIAKTVFESLGAQLFVINNEPNGININDDSGSTHINSLCEYVKDNKLDIGFAFDGDADRCIAVDEKGNQADGDKIIYLLANKLKKQKALNENAVVITEMSNTGLIDALKEVGIKTVISDVGDRNVLEKMIDGGYELGGEQSGHIIMKKYATLSDGILTALMIVDDLLEKKLPLSELVKPVRLIPQIIKTIYVDKKEKTYNNLIKRNEFQNIKKEISKKGRLLIRASNTESAIRIMVEYNDTKACLLYIDKLCSFLTSNRGVI